MLRNHLYLKKKYQAHFAHEIKQREKVLINRIKNNLLYNSQRIKICKYLLKGWIDATRNKMGKISKN